MHLLQFGAMPLLEVRETIVWRNNIGIVNFACAGLPPELWICLFPSLPGRYRLSQLVTRPTRRHLKKSYSCKMCADAMCRFPFREIVQIVSEWFRKSGKGKFLELKSKTFSVGGHGPGCSLFRKSVTVYCLDPRAPGVHKQTASRFSHPKHARVWPALQFSLLVLQS